MATQEKTFFSVVWPLHSGTSISLLNPATATELSPLLLQWHMVAAVAEAAWLWPYCSKGSQVNRWYKDTSGLGVPEGRVSVCLFAKFKRIVGLMIRTASRNPLVSFPTREENVNANWICQRQSSNSPPHNPDIVSAKRCTTIKISLLLKASYYMSEP